MQVALLWNKRWQLQNWISCLCVTNSSTLQSVKFFTLHIGQGMVRWHLDGSVEKKARLFRPCVDRPTDRSIDSVVGTGSRLIVVTYVLLINLSSSHTHIILGASQWSGRDWEGCRIHVHLYLYLRFLSFLLHSSSWRLEIFLFRVPRYLIGREGIPEDIIKSWISFQLETIRKKFNFKKLNPP